MRITERRYKGTLWGNGNSLYLVWGIGYANIQTTSFYSTWLYCISHILHFIYLLIYSLTHLIFFYFYKLNVYDNAALSKSIGAILLW